MFQFLAMILNYLHYLKDNNIEFETFEHICSF
jgi:hypothetical protein